MDIILSSRKCLKGWLSDFVGLSDCVRKYTVFAKDSIHKKNLKSNQKKGFQEGKKTKSKEYRIQGKQKWNLAFNHKQINK